MIYDIDDLIIKIEKLREKKGIAKTYMASLLGITYRTYKMFISKERKPSPLLLANVYNFLERNHGR